MDQRGDQARRARQPASGTGALRRMGRSAVKVASAPLRDYVNQQLARIESTWDSRMDVVQNQLLADLEASAELTSTHARSLTQLKERLDRLDERLAELSRRLDVLVELLDPSGKAVRARSVSRDENEVGAAGG